MRLTSTFPLYGLALGLLACQPDIGDPCTTPSDCSFSGDRICLTGQPGGYCSIFNCEPNRCPEEAVCVAYRSTVSAADGCRSVQGGQRLQRTFCMKQCSSDSDCRKGYACVGYDEDDPFSAVVVDRGKSGAKICAVPYSGALLPEDRPGDVCGPADDGLVGRLDGGQRPVPPVGAPDGAASDASASGDAGPPVPPTDASVGDSALDGAVPEGGASDGSAADTGPG